MFVGCQIIFLNACLMFVLIENMLGDVMIEFVDLHVWAGEKPAILAQASSSRLSESSRNSLMILLELSLKRRPSILSKEQSCSSEKVPF